MRPEGMHHLKGVVILGVLLLTGIAAVSAFLGSLNGVLATVGF